VVEDIILSICAKIGEEARQIGGGRVAASRRRFNDFKQAISEALERMGWNQMNVLYMCDYMAAFKYGR
jgi:hypothetical protein